MERLWLDIVMETKSMEKTYMCVYIFIYICIDGAKQPIAKASNA